MDTVLTLTELLGYSETLNFETNGWHGSLFKGYIGVAIILVGILFIGLGIHLWHIGVGDEGGVVMLLVGTFLMVTGSFGMHWFVGDMLTTESATLYDLEERKWEREMATPFLEALPVTTINGITDISYNYEMEAEEDKKFEPEKRTADAIPVTIVTKNGKTYEVWANVVPLSNDMSESILEMKTLEKDLIFHERSNVFQKKGDFDVTLYTDEKI